MRNRFSDFILITALMLASVHSSVQLASAQDQGYEAVFVDGTRVHGRTLAGWYEKDGQARLDQTILNQSAKPLRWLRNRKLEVSSSDRQARAYIELINGDRLPGLVSEFEKPDVNGIPETPSAKSGWLIVKPSVDLFDASGNRYQQLRLDPRSVRRVVWEPGPWSFSPKTLIYRDGRQLRFLGMRWLKDSVKLLLAEDVKKVPFTEIAQLHLADSDFWDVYFSELAQLSPEGKDRLIRFETAGGLLLTGSESRFDAGAHLPPDQRDKRNKDIKRYDDRIRSTEKRRQSTLKRFKDADERAEKTLERYRKIYEQDKVNSAKRLAKRERDIGKLPKDKRKSELKKAKDKEKKWLEQMKRNRQKTIDNFARNAKKTQDRNQKQIAQIDKQIADLKKQRDQLPSIAGSSDHWQHMLHPLWSRKPIWVKFSSIRTRWEFAPHEVPLTRLNPVRIEQRSLWAGWHWQRDRNVRGAAMRSDQQASGWGIGVHANNTLGFELPLFVRSFQARIGLDESAGTGGCVRVRVLANDLDGEVLYESPFLIGSQKVIDIGPIDLPGPTDGRRLLFLVTDQAHQGRPKGADPLDIRDELNWIDPVLGLDPQHLQTEIQKRLASQLKQAKP